MCAVAGANMGGGQQLRERVLLSIPCLPAIAVANSHMLSQMGICHTSSWQVPLGCSLPRCCRYCESRELLHPSFQMLYLPLLGRLHPTIPAQGGSVPELKSDIWA